jgi:glycosyltransferase involved in cell wall biosynthesis
VTVRVAVYCPSLDDMSGVREVVRQSSAEMVARGNPVAVIARTRHDAVEVDGASGVTILRVRLDRAPHPGMGPCAYRRFVHRFPTAAGDVVRAVRGWRPDVVATHCSKFHAPYVFAMRARVRAPIVVHLHNAAVTADGPESPRLQRLLQRCAARVIAVSEPVGDYARSCLPARAGRVVVVPNAIDRGRFVQAAPVVRQRPYILAVGRLAEQKGFDVLLAALAAVPAPYEVVLAGDGPDREALERRAEALGVAGRTTFLGAVDPGHVAGLMRGAAMIAIPSRFEGHPLVCLEAMAAGAPIIATDLPVMTSVLRHEATALLVPVNDVDALATALRRLHAEPGLARRLADTALRASTGFPTWADVTTAMLGEYERAIEASATAASSTGSARPW